jgi:putative ABC transport system permease protein
MAVTIQLGFYIDHELSTDKFNEKLDRIYRLEYGDNATLPSAVGHEIKERFGEEMDIVRMTVSNTRIKHISNKGKVDEQKKQLIGNSAYCDSTLFDIFTFHFLKGDPKTALRSPFSVVLTESTSRKLFGNENPLGKSIELEISRPGTRTYTVSGVVEDLPKSHLEFDYLFSLVSRKEIDTNNLKPGVTDILNTYAHQLNIYNYVLLSPSYDIVETENRLNAHFNDSLMAAFNYSVGSALKLRPLKDVYFASPLRNEMDYCKHGNLELLRIILVIATFVLFIASINYINVTTARSSTRAREVMIRKMVGASRIRLIVQFLVESVITGLVSFLMAITIVQILLPKFNQLAMTELSMIRLFQPRIMLASIVMVLILGLTAGIYPAIYLSRSRPFSTKDGERRLKSRSVMPRRILLTFQYAVSVVLIICVFTILKQLRYMKSADLGFNKELVVNISDLGLGGVGPIMYQNRVALREKLLKHPNIENVAFGRRFGSHRRSLAADSEINGIQSPIYWISVDPDFIELMDLKILEGRNFSWDVQGDYWGTGSTRRLIINESFKECFNLESPVGMIIPPKSPRGVYDEIIGVVQDYHDLSLHHKIEPTVFVWAPGLNGNNIKLKEYDTLETIKFIEKEYTAMFPDFTFEYTYLDGTYDKQYENDERLILIISNFAFVAVLIACLGLFGLSFFMASRRTKEIGIRKSLGASNRTVFILLSKEFIKWVALSVVIACSVAWIVMNKFLQTYAYRTSIGIWVFILATVMAFGISFIAVAWHAWKTARTNPIVALRYE